MEERAEHVWVSYTGRWDEDRSPGLLLGWRQREGPGWEGCVISAEQAPPGKTEGMVRQGWVPASAIQPVESPTHSGERQLRRRDLLRQLGFRAADLDKIERSSGFGNSAPLDLRRGRSEDF